MVTLVIIGSCFVPVASYAKPIKLGDYNNNALCEGGFLLNINILIIKYLKEGVIKYLV